MVKSGIDTLSRIERNKALDRAKRFGLSVPGENSPSIDDVAMELDGGQEVQKERRLSRGKRFGIGDISWMARYVNFWNHKRICNLCFSSLEKSKIFYLGARPVHLIDTLSDKSWRKNRFLFFCCSHRLFYGYCTYRTDRCRSITRTVCGGGGVHLLLHLLSV